ncbi:MAG: InlB B-repeat-containing protein, partial [Planctomycetes bacterium]|nr:InlB B-repeat-containing protein [Planctomycetota bacterium]
GTMSPQTIASGSSDFLTACGFDKTGYAFSGWSTTPTGVVEYADQASYPMGTNDVTLYAVWLANGYIITFDKNDAGATGTMSPQTIASGSSENLTICGFSKTGWTFNGWATTSGGVVEYADQTSYTMGAADVTLYAKWTANNYTITFDENDAGATGTMLPQTIASGSTENLTACGFDKTGWTFSGWATTSGGPPVHADQASYTMGPDNVTLFAKWTANSITVSFDAEGGSIPNPISVTFDSPYGALPTSIRDGYTFDGWWDGDNGTGTQILTTTTVTNSSNHTLYAKWTANSITVLFDEEGGSAVNDITVTFGSQYGSLPTTNRNGYTFGGWWDGDNGTGTQIFT